MRQFTRQSMAPYLSQLVSPNQLVLVQDLILVLRCTGATSPNASGVFVSTFFSRFGRRT